LTFINFKIDTIYRLTFLDIQLGAIKTKIWTSRGNKSFIMNKKYFENSSYSVLSVIERQKFFDWKNIKNKILEQIVNNKSKYDTTLGGNIAVLASRFILNNGSILSDCYIFYPQAFWDVL